ncbi:mechanosensitive ion channel protein MscS [Anaerosporomusa subterranea]|uniref:Mechanosensitive ion channel protein MscS n=1 Tax=Anaerosporomusa subterranea TaxID=1794912 RepID=A0A154BP84_ANASB|nr:mechanosensitive ion channel family protein [Anaerosporomusa subterranea]KYZ75746.1 mechanosensitive ion channel protein MscS [Anaerosporomusa subterranea]
MSELFSPDYLLVIGNRVLRLCLIVIGSGLAMRFFKLIVDRFFMPKADGKHFYLEEKRARTLSSLLKSIVQYMVYFVTLVMILQEFQIDTTSIIAGAGVIGLAIGFGAQTLVKDVITGFFIILEDQYSVGDYVENGDMAGTVEDVGFRITKLRGTNGVLHIIPNGAITKVTNYTRGHMQAVVNVPVAYDADINQVQLLLAEACESVKELPQIIEAPKLLGIVDFRPGELVMRIVVKTLPMEQGGVEAAIRQKIKTLFDAAAIPLPAAAQVPGVKLAENRGGKS